MTKLFNKVAIIGTGLIGGSMALDIKRRKLANKVIGVSRRKKSLLLAKKLGAIDYGSQEIDIIKGADLVILAAPVNAILNLANPISKSLTRDCLVTDVGSTKKEIVAKLENVFPYYVGSHPLAGSEKSGVVNACANIFKDSLCILTPTKNTDPKALSKIKKLWIQLGAKVKFLSPDEHDKILSFVSHLAHIVAFSLISSVPSNYLTFASNGLKDTTRIASSDSEIWNDIFLSNQKNILKTIDAFQVNISKIKSALKKRDRKLLNEILSQAKNKRDSLD
jgi:prephenate dehydrogenase